MTRDEAVTQVTNAMRLDPVSKEHRAMASAAIAECLAILGEPTLEMLQDGHEAARRVRVSGVSGMTIDAQVKSESVREHATWAAMLAASPLSQGGKDG